MADYFQRIGGRPRDGRTQDRILGYGLPGPADSSNNVLGLPVSPILLTLLYIPC
ncbi:hypothetical protein J6590_021600 [Homalodisca vitripennis]|nr:hypothetical protein J6590_021600 [Homalodisca vitripennis]